MWLAESTRLCSLLLAFIFLHLGILRLFLCPVSATGDGHLYFRRNVCVLKPTGEPADRLSRFSSWVLSVVPATAWWHCPSGRWHESRLLWSGVTSLTWSAWVDLEPCALGLQHLTELKSLTAADVKVAGACYVPLEAPLAGFGSSVWCWAHLHKHLCAFHKHHVGTKEQVGYVQKDIPALPIKMLMLLQAP